MYTGMLYIKYSIATLVLLMCLQAPSLAQKRIVQGFVRDSITGVPILNAIISNETTHKMVTPDQNGFFKIPASRNDLVFVNAFNYRFDTLRAIWQLPDTSVIELVRLPDELPGVTVTTQGYNRYQVDSMRRREEFVNDMGAPKLPPVGKATNMGAGIGINLDAFARKKTKDRNKAYETFDFLEKQTYIDYRFSPQKVLEISGLKGDSLIRFMRQHTPAYDWLRAHPTNEDVLYYINDKLKQFKNP